MSCQHEHALLEEDQQFEEKPKPRELDAGEKRARRKLRIALCCATMFMCVEVVGGIVAGSLAILTDAAHLLSDVVGFSISLFAIHAMAWPTSARMSFGFKRAEVIGALLSILVIWILTAILVYEAINRFKKFLEPNAEHEVDGKIMFIIATIGLIMNIFLMFVLGGTEGPDLLQPPPPPPQPSSVVPEQDHDDDEHSHDHDGDNRGEDQELAEVHHDLGHYIAVEMNDAANDKSNQVDLKKNKKSKKKSKVKQLENLNVQAAYVHALGDLVQSIGVCIAGGLIWYNPEWQLADPIATFLFGILVLMTTSGVIKRSVHVLMEGTPEGIDWKEIEQGINALPAVQACHDLHIWSLSAGLPSLSVHITSYSPNEALAQAEEYLHLKGIDHTTIQVEDLSSYHAVVATPKCGQKTSP